LVDINFKIITSAFSKFILHLQVAGGPFLSAESSCPLVLREHRILAHLEPVLAVLVNILTRHLLNLIAHGPVHLSLPIEHLNKFGFCVERAAG